MKRITTITAFLAAATLGVAAPVAAQSSPDSRFQAAQERFSREMSIFQQEFNRYQQTRRDGYRGSSYDRGNGYYQDDRYEAGYDPSRYYREGDTYQERVLLSDDRVYRGTDGRYYCKRSDGTTGLIIGAGAGGILGNVIDGGHSRVVGTLLGAAAGAFAGRAIDQSSSQNQVRCR
ncbi:MAG: glycine zipper 2TM domain-containing protein [Novosphingobium sp.]